VSKPYTSTGTVVATKSDIWSFELLGGETFQGVGFTKTQVENLWKFYGFPGDNKPHERKGQDAYEASVTVDAKHKEINSSHIPGMRHEKYSIPSWEKLREAAIHTTNFVNTGSVRNLFRHADLDGLRIMAFLSKFCEPGEDPVQLVARALADQGYDVSLDDVDDENDENDNTETVV